MKILYILTRSDEIGGAQVHVRDLATAMLEKGYHPVVVVGGDGPLVAQMRERGLRCLPVNSLGRPIRPILDCKAFWAVYKILKQEKPDIVSLHSSKAGLLGRLAAKVAGIPAVFTAHGWAFTEGVSNYRRKVYAVVERAAASWAAKIVTVSEYDYQLALRHRVAGLNKLRLIHNGMPDMDENGRAHPEKEPCRIIMVARFSAQKDHVSLLNSLYGLVQVPWELELIGEGPRWDEVEALADSLGILDRVCFAGEIDNVAERLARSSIFVLTSRWEGLPRSIIEAMRAGLPVVASNVGGVSELVQEGSTGYLVPSGDFLSLRKRLGELLHSPVLRHNMGQAGRCRFEKKFQFEAMFQKTLATYEEVLGQCSRK